MATVLVYSDNPATREAVVTAVGRRPSTDLDPVSYVEASTGAEVLAAVDAGGIDVMVLDGEAAPTGGLGLARQLKNEIPNCPPVLVHVRRRQDLWLGRWSQADEVLLYPVDPGETTRAVVTLIEQAAASHVPVPAGRRGLFRR